MSESEKTIQNLLTEKRVFRPSRKAQMTAHVKSMKEYREYYKKAMEIQHPSGQTGRRNSFRGTGSGGLLSGPIFTSPRSSGLLAVN